MQESTVTTNGQTTVPNDVRTARQLNSGDRVRYMILDGGEVRLVRSRPVLQLAGLLKDRTDRQVSLEGIDVAIAKGAVGT